MKPATRQKYIYPFAGMLIPALALLHFFSTTASAAVKEADIPLQILYNLDASVAQDLIIVYDVSAIEQTASNMRAKSRIRHDDKETLKFKRSRYAELKNRIDKSTLKGEAETINDYDHLPMSHKRFKSKAALLKFISRPEVKGVYENRRVYTQLTYSLPFISQPTVSNIGMKGTGTTVAVIDTGVNYTLPAFGSCTSPGVPSGCRVAAAVDMTGENLPLNTSATGHGTNVAGIVAGVAGEARIASVKVFPAAGGTTNDSKIISGINWAIANKSALNIVAINMSLGDGIENTTLCSYSSYVTAINSVRSAGIIPVASSGNNAFTNGISSPACVSGVVSVGAVYDTNWGGPHTWTTSGCTDSTTAADKITCFSNSASFLTMLAPGAFITAAGIQKGGTSQAAPHVAGALAIMRAAYPGDTLDQAVARLTSSGVPLTDTRNSITKPRLNLGAAIGPPSDDSFSSRISFSGDSGQITAHNLNATKESQEANHAGNTGGKSVWWKWTPATSGVAIIDTHNSSFNTLLAVYNGNSVSSLTSIASNDNDGSTGNASGVAFNAYAGTEYQIVVDGYNGASGTIKLKWSLSQQADLSIFMSGTAQEILTGEPVTYNLSVYNNGPSVAENVTLTDTLPSGALISSLPNGCSALSDIVTCTIGTISAGGSTDIGITIYLNMEGLFQNTAQVSSSTSDSVSANNNSTVTTAINAPPTAVPGLGLPMTLLTGVWLMLLGRKRKQ